MNTFEQATGAPPSGGLAILFISLLWGLAIGILCYYGARQLLLVRFQKSAYSVRIPVFFRIFMPLIPTVRPMMRRPEFSGSLSATEDRLVQGGLDQAFSPEDFLGLRLIYAVFFTFVGLLFMLIGGQLNSMMGLTLVLFGLLYPLLWLNGVIRQRHRSIQRNLPNILDLLTLSVEAGRDFLTALRDILRHRERDPIGEELERVFREIQLGKQRRAALRAMALRVKQSDLTSVVETLVQADELGVSIGQILRILGDQMRQKRFANAEKLANESPVKLLFPLFLFIFPAVIIVVMGPILLRSFQTFSP